MKIAIVSSLFLLLSSMYSFSQSMDEYLETHKAEPIQKIYIHTDKQFYFQGDTLWFAAYLVNGVDHVPVSGNSNLYVELINSKGEISQNGIFTMFDGLAQGFLPINGNLLPEGNYMLRSFNDYLRNFGEDYFFCENLKISNPKNNTEPESKGESALKQDNVNIDFFPEGGFLLAGKVNQLAFLVSGLADQNKGVSGKILDSSGQELVRFTSLHKGMGKLFFAPELNVEYTVKLDNFPDKQWKLPKIQNDGAKIVATLIDSAYVNLSIVHGNTVGQNFHIAVLHRGQGLAFINMDADNLDKMIRLSNDYFGEGVNRVVLLNQDFEPVSERLIFRDKSESVDLKLDLNKTAFKTREEVVLHIRGSEKLVYGENAGLSVLAVNNNVLNVKGSSQNIKSYLLIDSELKGQVPDPADFFADSEKVSARLKQDLLMLTQGWSNYIWNDLENKELETDSTGYGLTFKGKLLNDKKNRVIPNSDVFLRLKTKTQSSLLFTVTDGLGNFTFQPVFFSDTAFYAIQGNDNKGQLRATVELESLINSPEISPDQLNSLEKFEDIPLSLYHLNYRNEQALNEFFPDRDTRVLDEIEVTGKSAREDDGHYRIYNTPSVSLTVTKQDLAYNSIFQYLQGRASGVRVMGDRIIIHGFSSLGGSGVDTANEPLFILDGIPIDKSAVSTMKMSEIDKVEVLKSNEAAMFGSRGSTGVISIFSKSNGNFGFGMNEFPEGVYERIIGFSPYREFYSPRYNDENIHSQAPDFRTTLYWKPDVQLINGEAILSFFTCDNLSEYTIFVEGITSLGRACIGSIQFVADQVEGE